jgi:hypothetical protein
MGKKQRGKVLNEKQVKFVPEFKVPDLKHLLTYENPEVIARFRKTFKVSEEKSQVVFKDMLRYLWLTTKVNDLNRNPPKKTNGPIPSHAPMLEPMLIIDEMWHTFVLYTIEYMEFSRSYFGRFMHHVPTPVLSASMHKPLSREELEGYMNLIWDVFGEETVDRWFNSYPKEYSPMKLKLLQIEAEHDKSLKRNHRHQGGHKSGRGEKKAEGPLKQKGKAA